MVARTALFVAMTLAVGLFVACGGDQNSEPRRDAGAATQADEQASEAAEAAVRARRERRRAERLERALRAIERREARAAARRRRERREADLLAAQRRAEQEAAAEDCHPSYEGACLDPNASDYDCEGGSGDGPEYTGTVTVVGPDVWDLERDGDGVACDVS
jgi:hypothetical protein